MAGSISAGKALGNYQRLPRAQRFALVRSLVHDRQAELVLAYKNVLRVAYGYKTKGGNASGQGSELVREPCVIFVVSRKWRTPGDATDPQKLPEFLKATWVVHGKPVHCAVPTDVRSKAFYGNLKPRAGDSEAPLGLKVLRSGRANVVGSPACLLKRPGKPDVYVLSCRHVYSRTMQDGFDVPPGLVVTNRQPGTPRVGKTDAIRGPLEEQPATSFDAQIARVDSKALLAPALGDLAFGMSPPSARAAYDIGNGFYIATPRVDGNGDRVFVWVAYTDVGPMDITYVGGDGTSVNTHHDELIFGHSDSALQDGDSGSPAVRTRNGDRFIGMFVASDAKRVACIPAWALLDPANYGLDEGLWKLA